MIGPILAAVFALASPTDALNANDTNVTPTPTMAVRKSDDKTQAVNALLLVRAAQTHQPSSLDVHVRPIDPAGDIQAKLFELSG
jgi:hypothetical protein